MSFVFDDNSQPYRALLFVNGWNYGKVQVSIVYRFLTYIRSFQRVGNLGPQVKFPVPQGLLNYHGKKWVAQDNYFYGILIQIPARLLWHFGHWKEA